MTRLQKKCLVASACFHGLTGVVLLATAAFRSEPAITEERVLTLIPAKILDRPGVGGQPVAAVTKPQPAQPASPPQPAAVQPQPVTRPAPPLPQPQAHPAEPTKTVPLTTPRQSERRAVTTKPAPEPAPSKHVVKVDLTPAGSSAKPPSKPADSSAQARAAALAASKKRQQEIADVFATLDSKVNSKNPMDKVVPLPGEGGGEAFVNYRTAVFNAYYQAWKTPEDTTRKLAVADVKIVVARNGDIISSEFVSQSGDSAIDRSVQRALDAVKQLPPFPPNATDTQRSFIIRFNLEAKQSAG